MKILLSGHSRGIGKSINDVFTLYGHEIIGFSRHNNRNLRQLDIQQEFINFSKTSDVIILNANLGYTNVDLLYQLYRNEIGVDKIIIVIGSHSTETTKGFSHPYQIEKLALEEAARQLQNVPNGPFISIVRPGYVDTDSVAYVKNEKKINPISIANIVYDIVQTKLTKDYKILNILFVPN